MPLKFYLKTKNLAKADPAVSMRQLGVQLAHKAHSCAGLTLFSFLLKSPGIRFLRERCSVAALRVPNARNRRGNALWNDHPLPPSKEGEDPCHAKTSSANTHRGGRFCDAPCIAGFWSGGIKPALSRQYCVFQSAVATKYHASRRLYRVGVRLGFEFSYRNCVPGEYE